MIDALRGAAQALDLALDDAQIDRLARYLGVLQQWNSVYNLTAVRDPKDMLTQHLFDCLAIVPALRRHAAAHPIGQVLDVGSGGGLPGVVLAVVQPGWQVTCVDTVGKKAAFIRQAAGLSGEVPRLLRGEAL